EPLKVGDRVAADWYNPQRGRYDRIRGRYYGVGADGDALVTDEPDGPRYCCSPYSVRRLVKKPRRRVWINPRDAGGPIDRHSGVFYTGITPEDYSCNGWTEFVEVRRKK